LTFSQSTSLVNHQINQSDDSIKEHKDNEN